jgi:3-phytase
MRTERAIWTPCREAANEEPQAEGVAVDVVNNMLFVAFETIGLYRVPLEPSTTEPVAVGVDRLIEPIKSFGQAYHAVPEDDEFECVYNPTDPASPGDVVAIGSDVQAGRFLEADLEGLSIVRSRVGQTLMLASSQGDSSFHFYRIQDTKTQHLGSFGIGGVGESDGIHYAPGRFGRPYPNGLLVVQNGNAPGPADPGDVNGYEFDGATQFMYVNFVETLKALRYE